MNRHIRLLLAAFISIASITLTAQQAQVAAGGDAIGTGGSMSYSIGLVDYSSFASQAGTLNFGIQHPFDTGSFSIPHNLSLQNIVIDADESGCFNATQTVILAGNDTEFIVQPGGEATVIAGQRIILKAGTHIRQGATFRAWITNDDNYCFQEANLLTNVENYLPVDELVEDEAISTQRSFRVFPNPTTGVFSIELLNYEPSPLVDVAVFNMQGRLIMRTRSRPESIIGFDLGQHQPGIYIIRVISDDDISSARIIKH